MWWTTQRKVGALLGMLAVGMLVAVTIAWQRLGTAQHVLLSATEQLVPQIERMDAVRLNIVRMSLEARHAMLVESEGERAATLRTIGDLRQGIEKNLREFEQAISSEEGRKRFERIKAAVAEFDKVVQDLAPLLQTGQVRPAFQLLTTRAVPARNQLLEAVDSQFDWQNQLLQTRVDGARASAQATRLLLTGMVLGLIALGAVAGIVFTRRLLKDLGGEPELARAAAQRVAAGDLATPVQLAAGDHQSVLAAVEHVRNSMLQVIGEIRTGVDSVGTASREIAQGNHDLSSRTEQQASSLQQTAASMEQMTSAVKQNADAAKQANQLAASASQVAEKGGEVVGQVVATMQDITASSKKIAEIIGVIDGIAFQTNILALNAAVEAARAGEQGRGFAVVAGEVRNLAQRSAQAAREIKSLIGESVTKVENGSRLVNDAGQTMNDIVVQVKRVTDLIGEITSSTLEQSSGITQVNQAVSQLDQMTQQNAALVEQSAAAAQSLKEQADRLAQAVAIFKLSRQETTQAIAQAQAAAKAVVPPLARQSPGTEQPSRGGLAPQSRTPEVPPQSAPAESPDKAAYKAPHKAPHKAPPQSPPGNDDDWKEF
jgi:methyl-accepting chemotaxis protein